MRIQRWALFALLSSCVGCDQVSKRAATQWLEGRAPQSFLGDTFRLLYTENNGAFLGLGSSWPELVRFILFTLLASTTIVVALGWLLGQAMSRSERLEWPKLVGAGLLVAGGIGNAIDRVFRNGAVVDFLNLGIGPLRTGIFNLADVQLVLGGLILAGWGSRRLREPASRHAATPTPLP